MISDYGKSKPSPPPIPDPKPIFQQTGVDGHRALWVVTILMLLSSLVFYIMSARAPVQKRLTPILMSLVTTISFFSYLAMATGDGRTFNHFYHHRGHDYVPDTMKLVLREIFWARFVNWILTTPLILVILSLQGGLNGASMLVAIAADIAMFLTAMIASFIGGDRRKWLWYTLSCLAYLTLVYQIGYRGRRAAASKNAESRRFFSAITSYELVVFLIYPIVWAAGGLARKMSVNAEIIVYLILDVLSQGVFGYWVLFAHERTPALGVSLDGFWSNGLSREGEIRVGEDENA